MDLRTFVADTLSQIVDGVGDAQKAIRDSGTNAAVNPGRVSSASKRKLAPAAAVEFDVALVVTQRTTEGSESNDEQASGIVSVVQANTRHSAQNGKQSKNAHQSTSRVKFTVMVSQPADIETYQAPDLSAIGRNIA